uniref:Uncharacterized protein n=1 Tax=Anguilla anguilla TaxID=7936 RepID=A0A0E9XF17_ANGAN
MSTVSFTKASKIPSANCIFTKSSSSS